MSTVGQWRVGESAAMASCRVGQQLQMAVVRAVLQLQMQQWQGPSWVVQRCGGGAGGWRSGQQAGLCSALQVGGAVQGWRT